MDRKKTLIIIPMKEPSDSKTRLNTVLSLSMRIHLSLKLFNQNLDILEHTIQRFKLNCDILVLTESDKIDKISAKRNLKSIRPLKTGSLSHSVEFGANYAFSLGYKSLCVIPADLACPDEDDINRLLTSSLVHNEIVICPASDLGTNALLLNLPHKIRFMYGFKSFISHLQEADRNGLKPIVLPLASLRHDIDTTQDLKVLLNKFPLFMNRRSG